MTEFTLDTSGEVRGARLFEQPDGNWRSHWSWSDLDAFTQGYVEAVLRASPWVRDMRFTTHLVARVPGFSDLAPEALAAILKDCAAVAPDGGLKGYPATNESAAADARGAGAEFWRRRNKFTFKRFPPLTVTLGDDGKVYLGEASKASQ